MWYGSVKQDGDDINVGEYKCSKCRKISIYDDLVIFNKYSTVGEFMACPECGNGEFYTYDYPTCKSIVFRG